MTRTPTKIPFKSFHESPTLSPEFFALFAKFLWKTQKEGQDLFPLGFLSDFHRRCGRLDGDGADSGDHR